MLDTRISFFPSVTDMDPANLPSVFALVTKSSVFPEMVMVEKAGAAPETSTSDVLAIDSVRGASIVKDVCCDAPSVDGVLDDVTGEAVGSIFDNAGSFIPCTVLTIAGPNRRIVVTTSPMENPMIVARTASLFIVA